MSMGKDQESLQFWSSLLQPLAKSDHKDDLYPQISSPMMVMSTSMAINAISDPWNALENGDKEARPEAKGGSNLVPNECGEKSTEKKIECKKMEDAKEERKNLGKRPRSNESRNIAEKKRRTDIKDKIQKLKQMTHSNTKKDLSSTLESIVNRIREMKFYVESHSMGPMMPLGMAMDFPAPWFPFIMATTNKLISTISRIRHRLYNIKS